MAITPILDTAADGTLNYNSIEFNVTRDFKLTGKPVYDEADRTVSHIEYHLTVRAFITGDDVTAQEVTMEDLQNQLTEPGKTLQLSTLGFDQSITTNRTGTLPDIIWGVKPRMLSLAPVGGQIAWEVIWECEFNVTRCGCGNYGRTANQPMMAFNYSWESSRDDEGITTRTISGYCQVPAIRGEGAQANALLFNVDAQWDKFKFFLPVGFRRTSSQHKLNYAKNRIDFTIVDSELMGDAFPVGIISADIDYEVENMAPAFVKWTCNLSGTLKTAKGYPTQLALLRFLEILDDKVKTCTAAIRGAKSAMICPLRFRVGHACFGRESRFSATWALVADIPDLYSQAGVWKPVPGSNYTQWIQSINAKNIFGPRGFAGLKFNPGDDTLIDICVCNQTTPIVRNTPNIPPPAGGPRFTPVFMQPVTPDKSYLGFVNKVVGEQGEGSKDHRLAESYTPVTPPVNKLNTFGGISPLGGTQFTPSGTANRGSSASAPGIVTQYEGQPTQFVYLIGRATRIVYEPEIPEIMSIGGIPAIHVKSVISIAPLTKMIGGIVYEATWIRKYRIDGTAARLDTPGHPHF